MGCDKKPIQAAMLSQSAPRITRSSPNKYIFAASIRFFLQIWFWELVCTCCTPGGNRIPMTTSPTLRCCISSDYHAQILFPVSKTKHFIRFLCRNIFLVLIKKHFIRLPCTNTFPSVKNKTFHQVSLHKYFQRTIWPSKKKEKTVAMENEISPKKGQFWKTCGPQDLISVLGTLI